MDPSFEGLSPNNTIDVANSSFRIANLTANVITNTIRIRGYDPIDHTNSSFAAANTSDQKAVSAGVYANAAYSSPIRGKALLVRRVTTALRISAVVIVSTGSTALDAVGTVPDGPFA